MASCRASWRLCTSAGCCSSGDARGVSGAQEPGNGISFDPSKILVPCWFGLTQGKASCAGELSLMPAETPDGFFQQHPTRSGAAVVPNPSTVCLSCSVCPCLLRDPFAFAVDSLCSWRRSCITPRGNRWREGTTNTAPARACNVSRLL